MKYAIVMRTLDRTPRANYVGETLRGLERGGLWRATSFRFTLVESGALEVEAFLERDVLPALPGGLERFEVAFAPRRLMNNENAIRALELAVAQQPEWVIHLEDDVEVCADFLGSVDRWLAKHARPNGGLYSLYTPYPQVRQAAAAGQTWWDYPTSAFYGNQAWAMKREDAESAIAFTRELSKTWRSPQGFDLMLQRWAKTRGISHFVASAPSFVQHRGRESSIGCKFHEASSFRGETWSYA